MYLSADVMRALLLLSIISMALLAALLLRTRSLPFSAYLRWGLLIVFLPLIGPFLVILLRPGKPRSTKPLFSYVKPLLRLPFLER